MKIASWLIVIFLAPAIILLNFRILLTNYNFYQKEFEKLGVYSNIEKNIATAATKLIINYLCCNGRLDPQFFTQREILHMRDVKALTKLTNLLLLANLGLIAAIAITLLLKNNQKGLLSAFKIGSAVGIGAILVLSVSSLINFDFLFIKFHLFSFTNDLWLLSPESNLIKLFPQKFFQDFANRIATQSMMTLILIFAISHLLSKKPK